MNLLRILLVITTVATTGCASTHGKNPADPLEPFNRKVYQFNETVDKAIVKPVAQGYDNVMPDTGKILVINFFSNLDDVVVTANDLLQFKLTQAFSDSMRVLVNSTIGIGGLVDVASRNIDKHNEDFGLTLGHWGIKSGPYLEVPLLGPSTFRDSVGDIGDTQFSLIARTKKIRTRNQLYITKAIKRRAQLLGEEGVMEGAIIDRYAFIRDAYLQRRENQVYDGNPPQDIDNEDSMPQDTPAAP